MLLFFLYAFFGHAQNITAEVQRLKEQFKVEKNDEVRASIAVQVAEKLNYSDVDQVLYYAQQGYNIAQKNSNFDWQVKAIQLMGNVYIIKGNYPKATQFFTQAKTIFENHLPDNKEGLIKTLGSLGVIASEQSNYNKALQYYYQGKKLADQQRLIPLQIVLNNNIGVIYKSTQRYPEALKIWNETQALQLKTKHPGRGTTLTNMATIYEQLNQLNQMKKYLELAATEFKDNHDFRAIGEWNNNMGLYFYKTSDFNSAQKHWTIALQSFEKIQDQFGSFDTNWYLATLKKEQNQVDLALEFALKGKELADKTQVLEHQTKIEKLLSELYELKNDIALALSHSKKYQTLKDSLVNQENIRKMTEASMNFAFEKEKIQHQEALQQANNKQWFWALGILILVLLFGLFYLQNKKEQQKQQLLLENQLLDYKQKALHLQMNPHFLFNCLAAISSYIMQNEKEAAAKYLAMFSKLMRFTLESSKENWITLDKEIASLNQYLSLEQLRLKHIFDFTIDKTAAVEDDLLVPPMLIQPLVENAIIHGILPKQSHGKIALHLDVIENLLHVTVSDDGISIEKSLKEKVNQVELHKSLALSIIKERLEMLQKNSPQKARLEYQPTSIGTKVLLVIPIK